jgi:hypothetical protein
MTMTNDAQATSTRKPLSHTTWATISGALSHESAAAFGWESLADLEHQLAAATGWTLEQAMALVGAVASQKPVNFTWDTPFQHANGNVERTTTVAIPSRLVAPHGTQPGYVRISYWGFEHNVYLDQVVAVSTTETTRQYL